MDDRPAEPLTVEERAAVQQGLEDWRAGRVASAEDIEAILRPRDR